MRVRFFAFAATLGSLLLLICLAVADSYLRTSPDPVSRFVKMLLGVIAVTNVFSAIVAMPAAYKGLRYGSSTLGLALIQIFFLSFVWWVGIA